jgi:hypothetical protein
VKKLGGEEHTTIGLKREKKHFGDSSNTFANIVIGSTEFNRELGVVYSSFFTPIEACPSPYFIFVVVV